MKIVIDTNIFLSALLSNRGASYKLILWITNQYKLKEQKYNVISNTLVTEFEDVLNRDKNIVDFTNFNKDDIGKFINAICKISFHQKINFLWRPFLKDIKNDMVLEVAFNARARYIVTYNKKDFKNVHKYFGIKIVTPKEFLGEVR
jgi:putative PIN family toxin of toxin-antitoxin system